MTTVLSTQPLELERSLVCVVDGDPAVRDGLTYLCQSNGHSAAGFATRFAFLKALDDLVAKCVICEAQLPDGSGLSLYQELRRRGNNVPFALLLSRPGEGEILQAQRLGIQFVWKKPLTADSALSEFLEAQR